MRARAADDLASSADHDFDRGQLALLAGRHRRAVQLKGGIRTQHRDRLHLQRCETVRNGLGHVEAQAHQQRLPFGQRPAEGRWHAVAAHHRDDAVDPLAGDEAAARRRVADAQQGPYLVITSHIGEPLACLDKAKKRAENIALSSTAGSAAIVRAVAEVEMKPVWSDAP